MCRIMGAARWQVKRRKTAATKEMPENEKKI